MRKTIINLIAGSLPLICIAITGLLTRYLYGIKNLDEDDGLPPAIFMLIIFLCIYNVVRSIMSIADVNNRNKVRDFILLNWVAIISIVIVEFYAFFSR